MLKELIKQLNLEYVTDFATEENFPAPEGKIRSDVQLLKMDSDWTTEEALEKIKQKGGRPCTIYELLSWAKDNWNGIDWVVAFGSARGGNVLFLYGDSGWRNLDRGTVEGCWDRDYLVGFVSESLDSGTLGTNFDGMNFCLFCGEKLEHKCT